MSIRFGQVNLLVADMAASVEFYRLLDLDVPDPFEWPAGSGAQHVEIHSDHDYPQAGIWNDQYRAAVDQGYSFLAGLADPGRIGRSARPHGAVVGCVVPGQCSVARRSAIPAGT